MQPRVGVGGGGWGSVGGWGDRVSRHKLPLSAWAIMALHCPAASLQYGYDLSLSLTPSPGPLQSPPPHTHTPPIVGFSTRQSGQISALCLSALIDWMSLLPVECARSSAVSQRRGCQAGAWLEPSGLEGSYHSCQITDSLTPPLPTSSYCFFVSLKHPPDGRITEQKRERERKGMRSGLERDGGEEDTKGEAGFKSSLPR